MVSLSLTVLETTKKQNNSGQMMGKKVLPTVNAAKKQKYYQQAGANAVQIYVSQKKDFD